MRNKKNPYRSVVWLGIPLLMLVAVFMLIRPTFYDTFETYTDPDTNRVWLKKCTSTPGQNSCIHLPGPVGMHNGALQLAGDKATTDKILKEVDNCHLRQMKTEVYIDFIFIAAYTFFLILFIVATSRVYRRDPIVLIAILPIVAMVGDVIENVYLLKLYDAYLLDVLADVDNIAGKLWFFAIMKWSALCATFFAIGSVLFRGNNWYKFSTLILWTPLGLFIAMFFYAPLDNTVTFAILGSCIAMWLIALLYPYYKERR